MVDFEENIKSLILIASELEAFKLKVYTLLNKEKWLDDFIMNNAPCNYALQTLIREIQEGRTVHICQKCGRRVVCSHDCGHEVCEKMKKEAKER